MMGMSLKSQVYLALERTHILTMTVWSEETKDFLILMT